jgi:uncharacterized tellurite resistance protein B-like protein
MNLHLTDFNEAERTDYMMVVASMAGQDGAVTSEEIFAVRQLCLQFVLGPEARGKVMAATATPPENMDEIVDRLAKTDLRYSLLLDLAAMAYRDEKFSDEEAEEYNRLARQLDVDAQHSQAILQFASSLFEPGFTPAKAHEHLEKLSQDGIPRRVVSLSATMQAMGIGSRTGIHH